MASTPQTPQTPQATNYVPRRQRSLFAPIVLIGIGIVFLLVNMRVLGFASVTVAFAKYWPLFIILWGVVKLLEHIHARSQGIPAPGIGAGGVFLLIMLMFFGGISSAIYHNTRNVDWGEVRDKVDINDEDWPSFFGGKKFEYSERQDQPLPANGSLKVSLERGNIIVTPSADDKVHMSVRKSVYADNQQEADKISQNFTPKFSTAGSQLVLEFERHGDWNGGMADLQLEVPKKAALDLMTPRGKIEIRDRDAEIHVHNSKGDVLLENVIGNTDTHIRGGNFTARNIKGDVRLEGRIDDVNISDVTGLVDMQGDYYGDSQLSRVAKGVRFKSSRTDLEFARLDGDMSMSGSELRVANVLGPFRVETRSKDIHLDDISGEVHIDNKNGEVEVRPRVPLGNINVANSSGSVRVLLPTTAGFQVDARSERGDVETDFDKLSRSEEDRGRIDRLSGAVNNGAARVTLYTKNGTISVLRNDSPRAQMEMPRSSRGGGDPVDRALDKVDRKLDEAGRKIDRKMNEVEKKLDDVPKAPAPPDKPKGFGLQ